MRQSSLRRPRKEVPDDVVSCPPTLNLNRISTRRTKLYVSELVELSPQLAEIEERSKETDESSAMASARQSEVSSLATNEAPSVIMKTIKEDMATEISDEQNPVQPVQPPTLQTPHPLSRHPWPIAENERTQPIGRPPKEQPQPKELKNFASTQRSRRTQSSQHPQSEHSAVPARPKSYSVRRSPSVYSSVNSSMNSSMVSWDNMSQSVYSIYTSASTIARRPAWGHYVVGVMVFVGWMVHHWYFSEYFVAKQYGRLGPQSRYESAVVGAAGLILNVSPDAQPSMLRGAVRDAAIYRTQDYERRTDYEPVRSAANAFETMEDERRPGFANDVKTNKTLGTGKDQSELENQDKGETHESVKEVAEERTPVIPVEATPEIDEKLSLYSWTASPP